MLDVLHFLVSEVGWAESAAEEDVLNIAGMMSACCDAIEPDAGGSATSSRSLKTSSKILSRPSASVSWGGKKVGSAKLA